jgi:hypothetical protein
VVVRKVAQQTQNSCLILGLGWLSACLQDGRRAEPKQYVLFEPGKGSPGGGRVNQAEGSAAAVVAGGGTVVSAQVRYRLVDVNKFTCSKSSDNAAALNHNKVGQLLFSSGEINPRVTLS